MVEQSEDSKKFLAEITGIEELKLPDKWKWERNMLIFNTLCRRADNIIKWHEGDKDGRRIKVPRVYSVGGLTVGFLPSWDHVDIDQSIFMLPVNEDVPIDSCAKQLVLDLEHMRLRRDHTDPQVTAPKGTSYYSLPDVPGEVLRKMSKRR